MRNAPQDGLPRRLLHICDEDAYFQELVRYIHLNRLRVGMVKNMSELDRYPWCGHSAVMGRRKSEWQDSDYVLSWFGRNKGAARKAYRRYLQEGIEMGRREELVGGGLIRTLGGWSQVISLRQGGDRILCDERILGQYEFVERMLAEVDRRIAGQISINERILNASRVSHVTQQRIPCLHSAQVRPAYLIPSFRCLLSYQNV